MSFYDGAALILRERIRQTHTKGWSPDHDDLHGHSELALAAVQYALPEDHRVTVSLDGVTQVPVDWPWDDTAWKPTPEDRVRELEKAGALIAAEIDRLLRAKTR